MLLWEENLHTNFVIFVRRGGGEHLSRNGEGGGGGGGGGGRGGGGGATCSTSPHSYNSYNCFIIHFLM